MHLLAASMLFGLILASVPIIIHLLNRRRFRLVEWAPMKYLHLTLKTNRRRMRIEQLLLLIVRTLVVALLFIALARPALSKSALGGWLASRARTSRVVIIDDSLSMGYQVDHRSAFDSAKEAAAQVLRSIGAQDSVTALLASNPDAPMIKDTSLQDPGRLLAQLTAIAPADSAAEWAPLFNRVDDVLSGAAYPQKEVVVMTDLRRSGWSAAVSEPAARWAQQAVDVKIVDVGSRRTENVVLARFEQEDPLALPGQPLKLRASIRNDTPADVRGAQATLEIDGQPRPLVLPDLPAGQVIDVPITVTLGGSGQHVLRLNLASDALPADNDRWLSISVRENVDITLIDGQIGAAPFESSTDFLHVAFTAGPDPWQITRMGDSELQQQPAVNRRLSGADVIVIANVPSLSASQVAALEKLVAAGAGLMIFPGDQVDSHLYDQLLYRDGRGLLPARLGRTIDESPAGMVVEKFDDSPLSPLTKIAPEALARIRPTRFLEVSPDEGQPDGGVRVLARWNDSESHPAAIDKHFGRGRVILWTVTADRQWSDWPVDPTYVLAMRSAVLSIARPDAGGDNFTAGQTISYRLEDGQVARNPRMTEPGAASPQPAALEGNAIRHVHTSRAGPYQITWQDAKDAQQSRVLCASFDISESQLEPISDSELTRLLSPLNLTIVHWTGGGDALSETGREIWRSIAIAVLVLAAVETALAVWVGRER